MADDRRQRPARSDAGSPGAPARERRAVGPRHELPEGNPMSLRMRVWLACLLGAALTAGGAWWVIGTQFGPDGPIDPARVVLLLIVFAGVGIAAGAAAALWLDHHIIGQLRGVTRAIESGRIEALRELPAATGWGELSHMTRAAQTMLARERELEHAASELARGREQLERMRVRLEQWVLADRWEPLNFEGDGPLHDAAAALDRGLLRSAAVADQNLEAARLMRTELDAARGDARESVEQAERGFVEATALLTTVRELQRLGGELHVALAESPEPAAASAPALADEPGDDMRNIAARAIGELVEASIESVDHLGRGLLRVQDVAEQVRTLANRSTLIALNATIAASRGGGTAVSSDELKQLARDVRSATERTQALTNEIETDVATAAERMRDIRERVSVTLESVPEPRPTETRLPAPILDDTLVRLMERVREMIQDATRKGERLSAAGERSSRAAQRLVRRLDDQMHDIEGLLVRLAPLDAATAAAYNAGVPSAGLRLLERSESDEAPVSGAAQDDAGSADDARARRDAEPGAQERS